jgi:hypothetical protein
MFIWITRSSPFMLLISALRRPGCGGVTEQELAEATDVSEDVRLVGKGLFADIGVLAGSPAQGEDHAGR